MVAVSDVWFSGGRASPVGSIRGPGFASFGGVRVSAGCFAMETKLGRVHVLLDWAVLPCVSLAPVLPAVPKRAF